MRTVLKYVAIAIAIANMLLLLSIVMFVELSLTI